MSHTLVHNYWQEFVPGSVRELRPRASDYMKVHVEIILELLLRKLALFVTTTNKRCIPPLLIFQEPLPSSPISRLYVRCHDMADKGTCRDSPVATGPLALIVHGDIVDIEAVVHLHMVGYRLVVSFERLAAAPAIHAAFRTHSSRRCLMR